MPILVLFFLFRVPCLQIILFSTALKSIRSIWNYLPLHSTHQSQISFSSQSSICVKIVIFGSLISHYLTSFSTTPNNR